MGLAAHQIKEHPMSKYSEAKARKLEAYLVKHAAEHAIIAEAARLAGERSLQRLKDRLAEKEKEKEKEQPSRI
jgi:hypothetical protein